MDWYAPKYFKIQELVTKSFYNAAVSRGKPHYALWQFNPHVLMTADMLREKFGPITINNWVFGGNAQNRGLRDADTTVGAPMSPHLRGAALDLIFHKVSAEEVRSHMRKCGCFSAGFKRDVPKDAECFRYIGRVEVDISWFHFDIWNCYDDNGAIATFRG